MKRKKQPLTFNDKLNVAAQKYGDLLSILKAEIDGKKFNVFDTLAYSHIINEYFSESKPEKYMYLKDENGDEGKEVKAKIQTANALVLYLRGIYKKKENSSPTSG